MSMSGSKIREQVAHFLVDIHICILSEMDNQEILVYGPLQRYILLHMLCIL